MIFLQVFDFLHIKVNMEEDQNAQKRTLETDKMERKVASLQESPQEDKEKSETVTASPELSAEDKKKMLEKIRSTAGSALIKEEYAKFV